MIPGAMELWTRVRDRAAAGVAALAAVGLLFAEGAVFSGWTAVGLVLAIGGCLGLRARTTGVNLLVSLTVLCIAGAAVDLAARPLVGPRLHYTPTNAFTRRLPELPLLGRFDPLVNYTGPAYGDIAAVTGDPAVREPRVVRLRTDEAGFRNEPGAAGRRVNLLVLGDSFSAGWGTTQDLGYARVL